LRRKVPSKDNDVEPSHPNGTAVLYLLKEFRASNPDELHREISEIPGKTIFRKTLCLCDVCCDNPTIRDSRYANVRCKDAVVDRLSRNSDGVRIGLREIIPSSTSTAGKKVRYFLRYLGEPLSRRGYRRIP